MNGGKFMKEFNTYEKALIKEHVNPNICVMSSGADWMYINNLKERHYANITVIGSDPRLIVELDKIKDYDIMIFDTEKPFSESSLYDLIDVAGAISLQYNNKMSLIYSFISNNKKIAGHFLLDGNGYEDLGIIDSACDLRNMLDNSYKVLFNKNKQENRQKKKSK